MFRKVNLVTNRDGSDILKCTDCGFKKKYFGVERPGECPRCAEKRRKKEPSSIVGAWSPFPGTCSFCAADMIMCPKEGHPNSQYWRLQRNDGCSLFVCPNGCREDGTGGKIIVNRRKMLGQVE